MSIDTEKLELEAGDLILIIYALEERKKMWQRTRGYWLYGNVVGEIEDSSSIYEPEAMLRHYGSLLGRIHIQGKLLQVRGPVAHLSKVIADRLEYWMVELADVRDERQDVTSIREADAQWMIDEYEWLLDQVNKDLHVL